LLNILATKIKKLLKWQFSFLKIAFLELLTFYLLNPVLCLITGILRILLHELLSSGIIDLVFCIDNIIKN